MASKAAIDALNTVVEQYRGVDYDKLMRTGLGVESLEDHLRPVIDKLDYKVDFAVKNAREVSDGTVNHFHSQLNAITEQFNAQAATDSQQYIANKQAFINQISKHFNALQDQWHPFVTAAIEKSGMLSDDGIREAHDRTIYELNSQSKKILKELEENSQATLNDARAMADKIEKGARRTAAKISVADAQQQFKEAQKPLVWQLVVWSILSVVVIGAFGILFWIFINTEPSPEWEWRIVYFTAIRLAALGALGSLAAYCLKILRSQLHMFQKNLHRRRVANCIEALVESAWTAEQRDYIYARLVQAITDFGETGLIDGRESDSVGTNLTVDNVLRGAAGPKAD